MVERGLYERVVLGSKPGQVLTKKEKEREKERKRERYTHDEHGREDIHMYVQQLRMHCAKFYVYNNVQGYKVAYFMMHVRCALPQSKPHPRIISPPPHHIPSPPPTMQPWNIMIICCFDIGVFMTQSC